MPGWSTISTILLLTGHLRRKIALISSKQKLRAAQTSSANTEASLGPEPDVYKSKLISNTAAISIRE